MSKVFIDTAQVVNVNAQNVSEQSNKDDSNTVVDKHIKTVIQKTESHVTDVNEDTYMEVVQGDKKHEYLPTVTQVVSKYRPQHPLPIYFPTDSTTVAQKVPGRTYLRFVQAEVYKNRSLFLGSISLYQFGRRNSNIYKNIFPHTVEDYYDIIAKENDIKNTIVQVQQYAHGLSKYDIVYCDEYGAMQKALAMDGISANALGIISEVKDNYEFSLMTSGRIPADITIEGSSIIYLSDTEPGKMVSYQDIKNGIYIPVGYYVGGAIVVNVQQGSIGGELKPYHEPFYNIETYTEQEINDTINQIVQGVMT